MPHQEHQAHFKTRLRRDCTLYGEPAHSRGRAPKQSGGDLWPRLNPFRKCPAGVLTRAKDRVAEALPGGDGQSDA
jgi:hypothetical protein